MRGGEGALEEDPAIEGHFFFNNSIQCHILPNLFIMYLLAKA